MNLHRTFNESIPYHTIPYHTIPNVYDGGGNTHTVAHPLVGSTDFSNVHRAPGTIGTHVFQDSLFFSDEAGTS